MAFVSSSKDLGQWVGVGRDQERNLQVKFRLRRLDDDDAKEVEKQLGRFVMDRNTGVKQRVIPPKKRREAALRQACKIWTGCQNLWVTLTSAADVKTWERHGGDGTTKVGDEVCFDGPVDNDHPADELKRMVLKSFVGLTNRIVNHGLGENFEDVEDDEADSEDEYPENEKEEDLKKTS